MSRNFPLSELIHSKTATERGIDNTPTGAALPNLYQMMGHLEQVRHVLDDKPMIISSGYRCGALNRAVGGASTSAHVLGLAADFVCPSFGTIEQIVKRIADSCLTFDQLIIERAGGKKWVHISFDPRQRRECLRYDGKKYTFYNY